MVPIKFYDTEIIGSNSKFTTQVYNKMKKLPVYWTSQIPVRHKCNAIIMNCTKLRKLPLILTLRLKVLLTKQADSLAHFFVSLISIMVKTVWLYPNGCLKRGRLSQFIYYFRQTSKGFWKHLLSSQIILLMKRSRLMLFRTHSHCFY